MTGFLYRVRSVRADSDDIAWLFRRFDIPDRSGLWEQSGDEFLFKKRVHAREFASAWGAKVEKL